MPDLIMRSNLDTACRHYKLPHQVVLNDTELSNTLDTENPQIVLIDLDADPEMTILMIKKCVEAQVPRILAFCSHVLTDLIEQGRQAGAHQVLSNSTVTSSIPGLVSELAFDPKSS